MNRSLRLRSFSTTLALCLGIGFLASCTSEPLPRGDQAAEERSLAALIGRRHNPFSSNDTPTGPDSTGEWHGTWLLNNHLLILAATHAPATKVVNDLYLFGYSPLLKRYYMLTVVGGGTAPDHIDVSWFTINGRNWIFEPTNETVDGKAALTRRIWDSRAHTMRRALVPVDSAAKPIPKPRPEMVALAGWAGRWPSDHIEGPNVITGTIDSRLVGDGHFLGWFENNTVNDRAAKTMNTERVVRLWGFNDVSHKYYRIDIGTGGNGRSFTPILRFALNFAMVEGNLVLTAPLYKLDDQKTPARYFISQRHPDTLVVTEQYLAGGITWTNNPVAVAKWGRLK